MMYNKIKIVTFVPTEYADKVREALGSSGAGVIGAYSYCSFSVSGVARFLPSSGANPSIGNPNLLQTVSEERIEVVCLLADAKSIIASIKSVHPYEEVGVDIYPLIDEADL